MLGTRTVLGLAIDEFGIMAAEVAVRGGRPQIRRAGQLAFEAKLTAETAKDLGHQLRQFLRSNHFSSRHAIVGIPTKWIVAKEIAAPPATADALAGILSIQAERAFSLNANDLIFDYFGRTSTSESSKIMLLAARRQIVGNVKEMTAAAGLHVRSVTVSALAFGRMLSGADSQVRYGLYTRPTYFEFWSQANGRLRTIKHVPAASVNGTTPDRAEELTSAIRRLILMSGEPGQDSPHEVTVYDADNRTDRLIERLNKELKPHITVSDGRDGLLSDRIDLDEGSQDVESIAAAAVAMAGSETDKPAVDFLNPRLGRAKPSGRKRLTVWSAVAAVVVLLVLGAVAADWRAKASDIATYTQQLEAMEGDIEAAREIRDRLRYASSWTSQTPVFLTCLRDLTAIFPERGTIWARSLALRETAQGASQGTLVGRAVDEQSVHDTLDLIRENGVFSDVVTMYVRDAGGTSREKDFAITFRFQGVR